MLKEAFEGKAKLFIYLESKISKEMPVFYNPLMKLNRDLSIILLNSIDKENIQVGLPLAGSGVRGLRFLLELKKRKIKRQDINDFNQKAIDIIKKNLKLNKIKNKKIVLHNEDANLFLLKSTGFDYIDIDPWGSPNPYLDSAIRRLAREGILAVTATDTSALSGTFPKACMRKYWAAPKRDEIMHETGLRILIRKIQLIGAQYDKALVPIFSYSKDHYMRAFLKCEKSKKAVDEILRQQGDFDSRGPLWLGRLWDISLVHKMVLSAKEDFKEDIELNKFLSVVFEESKIECVGFFDIHKICKRNKKKIPKKQELIKKIQMSGYKSSETHFSPEAIRSDIPLSGLLHLI